MTTNNNRIIRQKNGEIVMEALKRISGPATFTDVVTHIANKQNVRVLRCHIVILEIDPSLPSGECFCNQGARKERPVPRGGIRLHKETWRKIDYRWYSLR